MTRNLKALGLALMAGFAMSAVAASASSAQTLTVSEYPATLTGTEITSANHTTGHRFTTASGIVLSCTSELFHGTATANTKVITITPTYSGCSTSVGQPVTVTMNGCDYEFHGGEAEGTHSWKNVLVDLKCPEPVAGPIIHIYSNAEDHATPETSLCKLTVAPFVNKTGNTATNTTSSPDDVDLTTNVTGINLTRTGSFLCGAVNQTSTYTGETTLEAYKHGQPHTVANQLGVTIS